MITECLTFMVISICHTYRLCSICKLDRQMTIRIYAIKRAMSSLDMEMRNNEA